jgi:hypothetical protein
MDLARGGKKLANRSTGGERHVPGARSCSRRGRRLAPSSCRRAAAAARRRRSAPSPPARARQARRAARRPTRAPFPPFPASGNRSRRRGEKCSGLHLRINRDVPTTGTSFTFTGLWNELPLLGGGGSCNLDAACDYAYDILACLAGLASISRVQVSLDLEPTGKGDPCVRTRYFDGAFWDCACLVFV